MYLLDRHHRIGDERHSQTKVPDHHRIALKFNDLQKESTQMIIEQMYERRMAIQTALL